jgi:hypothetical protein
LRRPKGFGRSRREIRRWWRRAGLGDARGFDQQVVEAALIGKLAYLLQQVVAQRAANKAIGDAQSAA